MDRNLKAKLAPDTGHEAPKLKQVSIKKLSANSHLSY